MTVAYAGILVIALVFVFINAGVRLGYDLPVSFGADSAIALVVYDLSMAIEHSEFEKVIPDRVFKEDTLTFLIVWAVLSLAAYVLLLIAEKHHPQSDPALTSLQKALSIVYSTALSFVALGVFIVLMLLHIAPWVHWVEKVAL